MGHFWSLQKVHQISTLGPLIYYRNVFKDIGKTRNPAKHIIFHIPTVLKSNVFEISGSTGPQHFETYVSDGPETTGISERFE